MITANFRVTVQQVLDASGQTGNPYAAERLGGTAVAKTIRTDDDYSTHTVVFPSDLWRAANPVPVSPYGLILAAHEMSRVMLGRALHL